MPPPTEYEKIFIIQNEFKKIAEALKHVEIKNLEDVNIANFDEVKAHLRNELTRAVDRLEKSLKHISVELPKLNISETIKISNIGELGKVIAETRNAIVAMQEAFAKIDFKPNINVTTPDVIVPDINIPEIKIPDIRVPAPQVTVNPEVALDLTELLEALEPLKFLSNKAANPISVRLSDGQKFIKALQAVADKAGQVVHAFATSSGISKDEYKAAENELYKSTTATNTAATVGIASGLVSAAKNRISIILTNDSDTVIYVAKGAAAELNKGIRLNANGGSVVIEDWNGAIYAISSDANKNLCVCEAV